MKKIFSVLHITILIALFSCEKDETILKLKSEGNFVPPVIVSQSNGFSKTVTEATRDEVIKFEWQKTGYGVSTQVNYSLQVDSECNGFETPLTLASTTSTSVSMTLLELSNKLINEFKFASHKPATLQLRVTSSINGKFLSISDVVSITITPWSDKPKGIWIGEGTSAAVLYATGASTYEGYRYITAGKTFKFVDNRICATTKFGSAEPGVLSSAAGSSSITITDAGYYKINVDTENLTYKIVKIDSWGLIGSSTPGGWNSSTPLTYNAAADTWETQISLVNGALKFRANDEWAINYGVEDITKSSGNLVFDFEPAVDITTPGNYKVELDFSQKLSPYTKYTYKITSLSAIPEPAKLWLPGGYQGYNPAAAPTIYATGSTTFEGYVLITAGTGFKFTSAPDWVHINYGYGGEAGKLSTDGTAPDISLHEGGYYKFNVNTADLTYSTTLITTWGMVGPSTLGGSDDGWNTSVAMTYDQTTKLWSHTMNLTAGALKFRANNGWGLNYGPADSNALIGTLVHTDAAITIPENGNYTVTLDFTRSEVPYVYTYQVVKN